MTSSSTTPATIGAPNLVVKQLLPDTLAPGQALTVEVQVTNNGSRMAENVSVSGWWTDGYTLTESTVTSYTLNGRKAWGMGAIGVNETRTLKVKLTPTPNTQPVEFRSGFDATFSSAVSDTRSIRVLKPEYSVSIVASETVLIGQVANVQVKVTNKGPIDVEQLTISVLLPEIVTHPNGTKIGTTVTKIPKGGSETIPLTMNVTKAGEGRAKVIVTALGGDPQEHEIKMTAVEAKMLVSMNGPKVIYANWPTTYEATIENQSGVPIRGSSLEVKLPHGMTELRASDRPGHDPAGHRVVWTFDVLQPGEKRTVLWFGFAKQTEDLTHAATVSVGGIGVKRAEWVTKNAGPETK